MGQKETKKKSMKLVIVESPAKAKTIKKYLGANFAVEASMGHIRDLPKSQLGVDTENNFEPKYITIRGKGELISKLKKLAKKSDKVYLATDPDREGEAISWHLAKILGIDEQVDCRIEFNEITKTAIKNSIKKPRVINRNLVDAQQARRVLDRLVGYEISPLLWKNVKWGLSAGRVQSAALKLICDREKEIKEFIPEEYWTIDCILTKSSKKIPIKLVAYNGEKIDNKGIKTKEEADAILAALENDQYVVTKTKESEKVKSPLPPFTTSTLQQDASRKLNFTTKKTMSVAQQLYEGVEIKGHGSVGLITYMRTDSVRISDEAADNAASFIRDNFGDEYSLEAHRVFKSKKKNIQDAHEAIRPTYIDITPDEAMSSLSKDQYKLYSLIWKRFIACQMADCILTTNSMEIMNGKYKFRASGSTIKFDGFMKVYEYSSDSEEGNGLLPKISEGEALKKHSIDEKQHFTQPPARYTEASFVKLLEEMGIGRPSTYVPTISTLLDRRYVERDKKNLIVTDLGNIVNDIVSQYFTQIVDTAFTASMENKLDAIEEGKEGWKKVVGDFFTPLKIDIDKAESEMAKIVLEDKVSDVPCDKCGRMMVIKHGRFGDFLACPGYPECQNTKPLVKKIDAKCPKCGGDVVIKRSRKGRTFYGCSNYPECDFVSWNEPTNEKCPECGTFMYKKYSKALGNYLECSNTECKHREIKEQKEQEESK